VKQSESVGRNVVDNFETALRRYYKAKKNMVGYIVAFSFGKGAHEEVARVKKDGMRIELITVKDILDKKFVIHQTTLQQELPGSGPRREQPAPEQGQLPMVAEPPAPRVPRRPESN
jgi:hypothetical protein